MLHLPSNQSDNTVSKSVSYAQPIYASIKPPILFLCLALFLALMGCESNSTQPNNAVASPNTTTQDDVAQVRATASFDLADTSIQTTVGKAKELCLTLSSTEQAPDFTVELTKPALNGKLTPSVSGKEFCLYYVPNPDFSGRDQFDFKICHKGVCLEKTWFARVQKNSSNANQQTRDPLSTTASESSDISPTKTTTSKKQTTMPTVPAAPTSSGIFDVNKKNEDGYVPKNDN